ncbi:MAG: hypothetical protein AAF772_18710 [Acidobacteriota bacterium]
MRDEASQASTPDVQTRPGDAEPAGAVPEFSPSLILKAGKHAEYGPAPARAQEAETHARATADDGVDEDAPWEDNDQQARVTLELDELRIQNELKKQELELSKRYKEQELELRKTYADRIYKMVGVWLVAVGLVVFLQGLTVPPLDPHVRFALSDVGFGAALGSATVTVIGLLAIVVKSLFPNK